MSKPEINGSKEALAAKDKEWDKLWDQVVWGPSVVKGWDQVAIEARRTGKYVHPGKLFGICLEKGSELEDGDPRKKYKYRVVFQGNRVVDQNMDEAQFQDMGSAPATIETNVHSKRIIPRKRSGTGRRNASIHTGKIRWNRNMGRNPRGRVAQRMDYERTSMRETMTPTSPGIIRSS